MKDEMPCNSATHTRRERPTKKTSKKSFIKKTSSCPFDWLSNPPHNPAGGQSALWVAVITQTMMDALSNAKNSEAAYHKNEAINWLTGSSKDFIDVCVMAGFDPSYVRKKAKKCLAAPVKWRAEPGKGKRYLERRAYRLKLRKQKLEEKENPRTGPVTEFVLQGNVIQGPWAIIAR